MTTRRLPLRMLAALCWLFIPTGGCRSEEAPGAAVPPAAERGGGVRNGPDDGYVPDELAWFREGRPVVFGGREWRPVGQPFEQERAAFVRVGEFEGMALFAAAGDEPPYEHLFFPLGGDVWQTLEPAAEAGDAGVRNVPGPSGQSPSGTGTGFSPE
ncbi:MAG TPA: hypothetical protein VKZ58_05435 [Longimicrobiales bacterium]|nr:hypothetical protein [Longimicrobiales bacterium]